MHNICLKLREFTGSPTGEDVSIKPTFNKGLVERVALRREAMTLHQIEGNSLDAEDIALFAMFDREGWSHEPRRAYIVALARNEKAPSDAE